MIELKCFNRKYSIKIKKLSKNDKFVTNKTKLCLFCYSSILFMKLRLKFPLLIFISHVIHSENLVN